MKKMIPLKSQSSLLIAASLLLATTAHAQISTNRFKNAVFSGTMNSNLPSIQTQNAAPTIYFPRTSTISFTSTLFCGDGDVANFQKAHSQMSFYTQDQSTPGKLVLGYWAVKGTQNSIKDATVPTSATWFSIGASDLTNDGTLVTTLQGSNASSTTSNAYDLLAASLGTLTSVSDGATWIKDKQVYTIYAAAMICPTFETSDGATTSAATGANGENNGAIAEKIMTQIISGNPYSTTPGATVSAMISKKWGTSSVDSAGELNNFYSKHMATMGVDLAGPGLSAPLNIVLSKGADGTKVSTDASALSAAQSLASQTYGYISGSSGGLDSQYSALGYYLQQMANGNTCILQPMAAHNFQTVAQYQFEPFPVRSTCGMAMNLAKVNAPVVATGQWALSSSCQVDPKYHNLLNPAACAAARKQMALAITQAVAGPLIMQAAAEEVNRRIQSKTYKINKTSCLPTSNLGSLNDVMKVAGSVHIPIISAGTSALQFKDPGGMVHPEPNFALSQYTLYENSAGDNRTVFNPAYNDSPKAEATAASALVLTFGTKTGYTFSSPGVNVQFHARAIGCPGPAFCANPVPRSVKRISDPI